jgi:hypothetical protein
MTQTFAVSPAFILKAHKVACSSWKTKLEGMYPEVFKPTTTFKQGDRVQFPMAEGFSENTYILAGMGGGNMTLISLSDGNRWAETVKVNSVNAVTIDEMTAICARPLSDILVNGATPNLKPLTSTRKTLTAASDVILQAYRAASVSSTKEMIKAEFPALFANEYVNFGSECTLSVRNSRIDDVQILIGNGLAPRPELENKCLVVNDNDCEVEIIREKGRTIIAFKKK